jgi:hypothetical protein
VLWAVVLASLAVANFKDFFCLLDMNSKDEMIQRNMEYMDAFNIVVFVAPVDHQVPSKNA